MTRSSTEARFPGLRRSRAVVAAGAAALLLIAACSGSGDDNGGGGGAERGADTGAQDQTVNGAMPSDGPAEDGGVLRVNETTDAPTLDPHKSASFSVPQAVTGTVYSKLVEFKSDRETPYGSMEVRPDLAQSYERSEDGLTWTFNLRKGVKFHNVAPVNGREFTSADVKCTIDRIQTLPGVQKNLLDIVTSLGTPDPYTVVFNLSVAYAAFDETMASFYMSILPCEGTRGEFNLAEQAIGTGPYVLTDWNRKVQRTYTKNPDYFVEGKPHIDELRVLIISDPAAAIAAMRTGELDFTGSVNETLLPTLTSTNPEMVVRNQLVIGPNQLMYNQSREPFDDYRVRKALSMALDRHGLGETFYGEFYKVTGPIPSVLFGGLPAERAEEMIPYDPEAARELLAEAGLPDGLSVKMLTTDGYGPQFVNQAQWVQQDLKEIGVDVTLDIIDYATYFSTFGAKDYDLGWGLSTSFLTADEWLQALYASDGPRNWFSTNDPELDQMIEEQRSMLDEGEREAKLIEINEYILENVLTPFMGFQFSTLSTQQPWVHNLYLHPAYGRAYMADAWLSSDSPTR